MSLLPFSIFLGLHPLPYLLYGELQEVIPVPVFGSFFAGNIFRPLTYNLHRRVVQYAQFNTVNGLPEFAVTGNKCFFLLKKNTLTVDRHDCFQ